jgi:hypothetical protein
MEHRVLEVCSAALVVSALEGVQQELDPGVHAFEQVAHAIDIGVVDAAGGVVHAAGVEEEQPPGVLPGIEQAVGAWIYVNAAAGVAGADQVRMAVPDTGSVDAVPSLCDQRVIGEVARQPRVARIPEALLGPQAPGRDAGSAGERGAS